MAKVSKSTKAQDKKKKLEEEIQTLEQDTGKSAKEIEKEEKLRTKIQQKLGVDEHLEKLKETKAGGVFSGFFEFLQKYSVIGLAIGLVIGDSSKLLVNSLVAGFINPFIGLFLPANQGLKDWKVPFRGQEFLVGDILLQTINFLIILFVLYFIIKIILRKDDLLEKK